MAAKKKPERTAEVLNAMADYLLGSGVSEATLGPAAAALGTSPRMLLYHFHSKEELVVAALAEVRRREIEMLGRTLARRPGRGTSDPTAELTRRVWRWYASPRRAPYLRLFFEAWGMSLQRPHLYQGFLDKVRKDLLPVAAQGLVQAGYSRRDAEAIATFMIAALRGLLMDLLANKDRRRLDDATEILIQLARPVMERRVATALPRAPRPRVRPREGATTVAGAAPCRRPRSRSSRRSRRRTAVRQR